MKKLFPIFLVLVLGLGLSSCINNEAAPFAGKYYGTFKFISSNKTNDGSVRMTQNPLSTNGLLLYACLPLDYYTGNTYKANSNNVEYMKAILESIAGANDYIDLTTEKIENIEVTADFSGNSLHLEIKYKISLLADALSTYVKIIEFDGSK